MDDLNRIKQELERQKRDRLKELAQRAELERRTDPPGTLMGFDRATGQPLVAQGGGIKPMRSLSNIGTVGDVGRAAGGGFDVGNRRSAEGFRRRSPEQEYKQLVRLILPTGIKYYVRNQKSYVELIPPIGDGIWPADITDGTVTSTGRSINDFVVLLNRPGVVDRWDGPSAVSSFYRDNHEGCGAWQISKVGFFCAPTAPLPGPIPPAPRYNPPDGYEFNLYFRNPGLGTDSLLGTPFQYSGDRAIRSGTRTVIFKWGYGWEFSATFDILRDTIVWPDLYDVPLDTSFEGQGIRAQFIRLPPVFGSGFYVPENHEHRNRDIKFDISKKPIVDPGLLIYDGDLRLGGATPWSVLAPDVLNIPINDNTGASLGYGGGIIHYYALYRAGLRLRRTDVIVDPFSTYPLATARADTMMYQVNVSIEILEIHTTESGNRSDDLHTYYWDNNRVVGFQGQYEQNYSFTSHEYEVPAGAPITQTDGEAHYNHNSSFPYNDVGSILSVTGNDAVPQPAYTFIARDTEPPEQSRFSLIQDGDGIKSISPSGATLFTLPPINGSFPYDANDIKNYSTIRGGAWYFGKNTDESLDTVPVRKWAEINAFTEANPKQVRFAHIPDTDSLNYPSNAIAILSFDAGTRMALAPPQGETPPGGGGGGGS